jgi:hypothetical protein
MLWHLNQTEILVFPKYYNVITVKQLMDLSLVC